MNAADRGGGRAVRSAWVGLLARRGAADLVVFQDAGGVPYFEGGDLLAFFEGDDDAAVGGVGGGGAEQCGDQQALQDFGGCHFGRSPRCVSVVTNVRRSTLPAH